MNESMFLSTGARARQRITNHPLAHTCPRHLRVVCGVCTHFEGELYGRGACAKHDLTMKGGRDARDCADWSRRMASGQPKT